MSPLDSIELSFRFIKNNIYKKLFYSIEQVKKEFITIIESDELKISLILQFKETLQFYLKNII
jgi:hypothetical protein